MAIKYEKPKIHLNNGRVGVNLALGTPRPEPRKASKYFINIIASCLFIYSGLFLYPFIIYVTLHWVSFSLFSIFLVGCLIFLMYYFLVANFFCSTFFQKKLAQECPSVT